MLDAVVDLAYPGVRSRVDVGASSHTGGLEISPTGGDRIINVVADERSVREGSELCKGENAVGSFFRVAIHAPGAILVL